MPPTSRIAQALKEVVRESRTKRGWTLECLAEKAGLHRNSIVKLERGRTRTSVETLFKLAGAFGERASAFLGRVEKKLG